ncbi:MYXO-CTERM sorting domain-containing protein [Priestia megaterium]
MSHILLGSGIVLTLVALITLWRLRRRKNEETTLDS